MLKVKAGDLDRMGLLFERHYKPLFGFLYRMTADKDNSEDMVQNVFLRMLKYRHTFKGDGEFRTWMYHLARNVLNDQHKQAKRQAAPLEQEFREVADEAPESASDKEEQVNILNRALTHLTEENREILVLSRYQELAYSEIARILNISEVNVRVRIHRAMTQLKSVYLKLAD
ncbi:MAG: RNA polymerase sigma factor [Leadbetterella sp.]|nr:RNA polymerase sigma factor [Leadbetterella sp.]